MRRRAAVLAVLATACAAVDVHVTARYPLDEGDILTLRGDGCGLDWGRGIKMAPDSSSQSFTTALSCPSSVQLLQFKVMLNENVWQVGANEALRPAQADTASATVYPWFGTQNGTLQVMRKVFSPELGNARDVVLYLPPSFTENTLKRYEDVLMMHDGNNLFGTLQCESCCPFGCWNLELQALDPLIVEGGMREIVVVGVFNTANRTSEYTYSRDPEEGGGNGDRYLDFLQQTLLPAVLQAFPRVSPRDGRVGLLGSSLGGLISCYAGWTRPTTFSKSVHGAGQIHPQPVLGWKAALCWPLAIYDDGQALAVGCMSSSFWWNNEDFNRSVLTQHATPTTPGFMLYLDSGDSGPDADDRTQTLTVRKHLQALGLQDEVALQYFLDNGGQHNEYFWGRRVWRPLTWMYPPFV